LRVPPAATPAALRQAFARWGLPATVRVDNGGPWGSAGDLPPDRARWLWGLGIDVHWNDPRVPQQNGAVERAQGTGARWAEPGQCDTPEELQRRLDEMDALQREAYPSIAGQSRRAAFPGLAHSGRRYRAAGERANWNHRRVRMHRAG
jgi:transposase InsO family protein